MMFCILSTTTAVLLCLAGASDSANNRQDDLIDVFPHVRTSTPDHVQSEAVRRLVRRLLPQYFHRISFEVNRSLFDLQGRDLFQVSALGGGVHVMGSSGSAVCAGLLYYLKYTCHVHVSWDHNQLRLPSSLPSLWPPVVVRAVDRFRYFGNICTNSYSSVWWNWLRWQRHLDWLALNGVNMVLVPIGQETLWWRVWRNLGLPASSIDNYFTGPAFLAWNRMGNIKRWAGPLSPGWMRHETQLLRRIVLHLRQLGIVAVLPAFCGHVPDSFSSVFPGSDVVRLSAWNRLNSTFSSTLLLRAQDPLFQRISSMFMNQIFRHAGGSNHVYACDMFNEQRPYNASAQYLAAEARATVESMTSADPVAVWLLQGWQFFDKFWGLRQVEAYLSAVPKGRLIVLDLYSDVKPLYRQLHSYFGHAFVWCMLHNFGARSGLKGTVESVTMGPFDARHMQASSIVGTGLTMEGIEQNYVMYDLMLEMGWRHQPPNVSLWFEQYAARRYGDDTRGLTKLQVAWSYLMRSVYNYTSNAASSSKHIRFPVVLRPKLKLHTPVWYNISHLLVAWDLMMEGSNEVGVSQSAGGGSDNLLHDLVDVTREVLSQLVSLSHHRLVRAFHQCDMKQVRRMGVLIQSVLLDMDFLLSTDSLTLLGVWLRDAKLMSHVTKASQSQAAHFEMNARNQITMWGPDSNIVDYAGKQWSGMMADYYLPRWTLFLNYLEQCHRYAIAYNQSELNSLYERLVERPFSYANKTYPHLPKGDAGAAVRLLHAKYRRIFQ